MPPRRDQSLRTDIPETAGPFDPGAVSIGTGLPVDGGVAPDPDAPPAPELEEGAVTVEVLPGAVSEGPVTVDQAVFLLRAVWGVAHHATKLTGGPDDAFEPSVRELRDQAEPLAEIANRYPWLAMVIRHSPYLAAAVAIGGYAGAEVERIAEHRAGATPAAGGTGPIAPEQTFGVRAAGEPVGMRYPPRPGPAPSAPSGPV